LSLSLYEAEERWADAILTRAYTSCFTHIEKIAPTARHST